MGTKMTTIRTTRLLLRPFEEADARRVAYLAGEYDVAKMCGRVPHPYTMASAYDFIDITRAGRDERRGACVRRDGADRRAGRLGAASCASAAEDSATYEIGYWFGVPYWGLGYASETARALMDWAREAARRARRSWPGISSTTRRRAMCCASWALRRAAGRTCSAWRGRDPPLRRVTYGRKAQRRLVWRTITARTRAIRQSR